MSCHAMSCHVMPCHAMSCHVMSYHQQHASCLLSNLVCSTTCTMSTMSTTPLAIVSTFSVSRDLSCIQRIRVASSAAETSCAKNLQWQITIEVNWSHRSVLECCTLLQSCKDLANEEMRADHCARKSSIRESVQKCPGSAMRWYWDSHHHFPWHRECCRTWWWHSSYWSCFPLLELPRQPERSSWQSSASSRFLGSSVGQTQEIGWPSSHLLEFTEHHGTLHHFSHQSKSVINSLAPTHILTHPDSSLHIPTLRARRVWLRACWAPATSKVLIQASFVGLSESCRLTTCTAWAHCEWKNNGNH